MEPNFQNKRDARLFDAEVNPYAENIRRHGRVVNTAISLGSLSFQRLLCNSVDLVYKSLRDCAMGKVL